MSRLHLDFETASELNIKDCGIDRYSSDESTRILMLSWALNEDEPQIWEPDEPLPNDLYVAIKNENIELVAWKAEFERYILARKMGFVTSLDRWVDPSVLAKYLSMPGGLDKVGKIIELSEDLLKINIRKQIGKSKKDTKLVTWFSLPKNKNKKNRLFGLEPYEWRDKTTHPDDWADFREYCKRDLKSERAALHILENHPLPELERRAWLLDQKINDRGMPVDMLLVNNAFKIANRYQSSVVEDLKEKTGLENPKSRPQMLEYLKTKGYKYNTLEKKIVTIALAQESDDDQWSDIMKLRQEATKTSANKFGTIKKWIGNDGRLRHQFLFMGAARTARWSGQGVQLQNLPRPVKAFEKNTDLVIDLIHKNDFEGIAKIGSPIELVSSAVRPAFRASPGKKLVVCDLNAIENRVLGWMSGCKAIVDVFAQGKDPYLAFAAIMYNVDYDEIYKAYKAGDPKAKEMRQMAKPAVLGAGYRLGGGDIEENRFGDLIKTGLWGYAEGMGITMSREDAHKAVEIFRKAYPEVSDYDTGLWAKLEQAAKAVILGMENKVEAGHCIFDMKKSIMRIQLPSGRYLHYIRPRIETGIFKSKKDCPKGKCKKCNWTGTIVKEFERDVIVYDGQQQVTKVWGRITSHGGKFTENIDQAISRDILLNGMFNADESGMTIVGSVHDEIICEESVESKLGIEHLRECMIKPPVWATDMPLGAEGYENVYYKKG